MHPIMFHVVLQEEEEQAHSALQEENQVHWLYYMWSNVMEPAGDFFSAGDFFPRFCQFSARYLQSKPLTQKKR